MCWQKRCRCRCRRRRRYGSDATRSIEYETSAYAGSCRISSALEFYCFGQENNVPDNLCNNDDNVDNSDFGDEPNGVVENNKDNEFVYDEHPSKRVRVSCA